MLAESVGSEPSYSIFKGPVLQSQPSPMSTAEVINPGVGHKVALSMAREFWAGIAEPLLIEVAYRPVAARHFQPLLKLPSLANMRCDFHSIVLRLVSFFQVHSAQTPNKLSNHTSLRGPIQSSLDLCRVLGLNRIGLSSVGLLSRADCAVSDGIAWKIMRRVLDEVVLTFCNDRTGVG